MRKLKWFAFNFAGSALMYWALVLENVGAQRVLIFLVWAMFLVSFVAFHDETKKKMREKGRSVSAWVDGSYDLAATLVFIYFGWWFTGIAYFLHFIIAQSVYEEPKKQSPGA